MDSDTIYEEETLEMNNESDAKDQNTDSESEINEVIVGEEVIEQHLDEVVIYDSAPAMSGRRQDGRKPQQQQQMVTKKDGVVNVRQQQQHQSTGIINQTQQQRGQQQRPGLTAKPTVKLMPGQKIFPMAKPVKLAGFSAGQIMSPQGTPVKRKADGSPMIVKLDQLKKARPAESPLGGEKSTILNG